LKISLTAPRLTQVIVLAALSLLWATGAHAEEQRCAGLGTNCICSEPLQMTSFTPLTDNFYNPTDSTTKECKGSVSQPVGSALWRQRSALSASTDATAMAALPSGHGVQRFLRSTDDHQHGWWVGHNVDVPASFVRIAARWYIYRTPTFDFNQEGTCINTKIAQMGAANESAGKNHQVINWAPGMQVYNFLHGTPSLDCCLSGPAKVWLTSAEQKGKWWVYEIAITNRAGPAYRTEMWARNVTDNGNEKKVIDTAIDSRVNNWTPPATSLVSGIRVNNHRYGGTSGTCRGWIGISHYLMAGWTTNAGQRIGPALEIEGANIPKPPPPTNVKVE